MRLIYIEMYRLQIYKSVLTFIDFQSGKVRPFGKCAFTFIVGHGDVFMDILFIL